jgi:hypothetical protein
MIDRKRKYIKKKNWIDDLMGFTKSLLQNHTNFIMHFKNRADEEL